MEVFLKASLTLAALAFAAMTSTAFSADDWSNLTRDETIAAVSKKLAEINAPFTKSAVATADKGWIEQTFDAAISQVAALKDALEANPYVQIDNFSVSLPWGVSVELSFKSQK